MSGGVALIDYDRDGWPDIYFSNAQSVEMALAGKKSRSALYHNNHDGTFTDVTDKAGIVDVGKAELLKYDLCREITRTVPGVPFVILSANACVGSNPHWAKNGPKKTVSA